MLSQIELYTEQSAEPIKQVDDKQKDPKNMFPSKDYIYSPCNFLHLSRKINAIYMQLL